MSKSKQYEREALAYLKQAADIPHMATPLTLEARNAVSNKGKYAGEWTDKPHRLVYRLCSELELLAASVAALHLQHPNYPALAELYLRIHKEIP